MKRERPGQKQVNWWFPDDLLEVLKDYQHAEKLDHLRDAAEKAIRNGLPKPQAS